MDPAVRYPDLSNSLEGGMFPNSCHHEQMFLDEVPLQDSGQSLRVALRRSKGQEASTDAQPSREAKEAGDALEGLAGACSHDDYGPRSF